MVNRYSNHYSSIIICIILMGLFCVSPIYAAEMSNEQISSELTNFFTNEGASSLSSDDLRTIGILFIMAADLKEAYESGAYEKIPTALDSDTYACVGADTKTDYFSMLFIFLNQLESNDNNSFEGMNFGDLMVALGMAEESAAPIKTTPVSTDPNKKDINVDAMIKAGLNIPVNPEMYSQYVNAPIAQGETYTGYSYEGGMNP